MKRNRFSLSQVRSAMPGMITPQGKNAAVSKRLGNTGILEQQGTSVKIYDSLPLDGRTVFNFFDGVNARNYPLTNLNTNQLGVGETMVMERMYLVFFSIEGGVVSGYSNINAFPNWIATAELNFVQNNSRIVKNLPLSSMASEFNFDSGHNDDVVMMMDTDLVLQPLLEFVAAIRVNDQAAVANTYVKLVIEGGGSIPSTKNNF
jgi:hypothetical protein